MKNKTCGSYLLLAAIIAACLCVASTSQAVTVFKDDFNRADSSTVGSTAGPGSGTWTEAITPGGDSDVAIAGNLLLIDHGNTDSLYEVGMSTAGFWPWASTLAGNPGKVTWNINMQSSRDNLSGFGGALNGIGFALASTAGSYSTTNGYAIVWGNSGSVDPIFLVRFTGASSAPIIAGSGTPFGDLGTNYLSIRVEYEPSTDTWTLFGRDDGSSAFADPATGGGYVNLGSVVDSTHTSDPISQMGMFGFFTTDGASNIYRYDNLSVDVVPEPSAFFLGSAALLGLAVISRRRKATGR